MQPIKPDTLSKVQEQQRQAVNNNTQEDEQTGAVAFQTIKNYAYSFSAVQKVHSAVSWGCWTTGLNNLWNIAVGETPVEKADENEAKKNTRLDRPTNNPNALKADQEDATDTTDATPESSRNITKNLAAFGAKFIVIGGAIGKAYEYLLPAETVPYIGTVSSYSTAPLSSYGQAGLKTFRFLNAAGDLAVQSYTGNKDYTAFQATQDGIVKGFTGLFRTLGSVSTITSKVSEGLSMAYNSDIETKRNVALGLGATYSLCRVISHFNEAKTAKSTKESLIAGGQALAWSAACFGSAWLAYASNVIEPAD